jgi:DNA-binding transcriptional LysR family regulator
VQIDLEEQVSEQVVLALREGRADVGVFVAGPPTDGLEVHAFRQDELVLILPREHALAGKTPLAFVDALEESWISLNPGAALLQQQQSAAMAAGRPLKLRMQVRSFDAVGHMVASGLGIALLPKAAALPIVRAMKLSWRPLQDAWAHRTLQVAVRKEADSVVTGFRDFFRQPSQTAKAA